MSKPDHPTLEDVALRAGVSTATVSRCLNSPDRVADTTRDTVLAAVEMLGYTPNFTARALAANRSNAYGAIIPTMTNAIFARGLEAFQTELGRHEATLLVASSGFDPAAEEAHIRTMVARGADGLLLIGAQRSDKIYRFLQSRQIPVVIAWTYGRRAQCSFVGFDNRAATEAMADHAISLGHRRFALLSAPRSGNDRARDRVAGVRRALVRHDIDATALPVLETPYSITAAGDAFALAMQHRSRPSIVMCGNDVQAVGALLRARELGLGVPDDVSITGFDDIELARVVEPGLTTVHVPHREMGRRAAQILLAHVNEGAGIQRIRLDTTLVERGSLGAVPDRSAA